MPLFILLIFSTLFIANIISWAALNFILTRLDSPEALHWSLAAFIVFQIAGIAVIIGARAFGFQPGTGMGKPLLSLFMIWNLLLALPTALFSTIWALVLWAVMGTRDTVAPESPWRWAGLIVVALPFVAAFIATAVALWQLNRFRINRITLSIPNLPEALKNLTIVHLSDLHIGKLTRGPVLDDMVAATNGLDADLILLTGDLINMSLDDLPRAFELLKAMKSRYGLYLCEGNHDLLESRAGVEAAVKLSGLPFLLNQSVILSVKGQPVQILGLRWGEGMGHATEAVNSVPEDIIQRLLAQREPRDFTILLAHHPAAFDAAAAAGIPLTLAGHTHGGQLMLSRTIGFGPWFYRYWSGLYQKGASQLIVSNGAGNWFPLRVLAPAEIIHVTLA